MESFKKESSAMPEMPKICATLPSYNLFNSAPYSPTTSRPGSAMSMSSERPFSASDHTVPPKTRTIKVSVAVDSTDDEDLPADAYLPQRSGGLKSKKKNLGTGRRRATSTDVSDTESEDSCYQVYTNERMTPLEAKQKAEEGRQKAAEDEARLQEAVKEQLKREEEEEIIRQEELAVKKKE